MSYASPPAPKWVGNKVKFREAAGSAKVGDKGVVTAYSGKPKHELTVKMAHSRKLVKCTPRQVDVA